MTIERGRTWGETVTPPSDIRLVASDAETSGIVRSARSAGTPVPPLGLVGGDLARTLGGGSSERFDGEVVRVTVDLLRVEVEGRSTVAAAHVVARRRWWRGPVVFVMNAQFLGPFDVAPRSHPNDGLADVLEVDGAMALRARLQARRRARTGTHVPHPQLAARRLGVIDLRFGRSLNLWVDGERWATTDTCRIVVEPDALVIHA